MQSPTETKPCILCDAPGVPEPGFNFYACDACCDKLADRFEARCDAVLKALDEPRAGSELVEKAE